MKRNTFTALKAIECDTYVKGVAYLVQEFGIRWFDKVNKPIDQSSTDFCVLGQAASPDNSYGDYCCGDIEETDCIFGWSACNHDYEAVSDSSCIAHTKAWQRIVDDYKNDSAAAEVGLPPKDNPPVEPLHYFLVCLDNGNNIKYASLDEIPFGLEFMTVVVE